MVFELKSSKENICTLLSIISLKKIFSAIHQKKKRHILKCTKDSKNNQSIFKSSSVPKLAKCMHVMCENNERYDYRIARWI